MTGTPALTFGIGTQEREAEYVRGSGTKDVTFAYQVQSTDTDTDGIDVPRNLSDDSIVIAADESIVSLAHGRKAVFPGDGAREQSVSSPCRRIRHEAHGAGCAHVSRVHARGRRRGGLHSSAQLRPGHPDDVRIPDGRRLLRSRDRGG